MCLFLGSQEDSNAAKLWTDKSTLLLIELVREYEDDFNKKIKKFVWQKIANLITDKTGIKYTATQVDTKWKGMVKTYKDVKSHNSETGKNRKGWKYYKLLDDMLFKRPEITAVATCSSSKGLVVKDAERNQSFKNETISQKEGYESTFSAKRKLKEASIDRRHNEKMARIDKLQSSLDKMVSILETSVCKKEDK